jgi:hypothetical protein
MKGSGQKAVGKKDLKTNSAKKQMNISSSMLSKQSNYKNRKEIPRPKKPLSVHKTINLVLDDDEEYIDNSSQTILKKDDPIFISYDK